VKASDYFHNVRLDVSLSLCAPSPKISTTCRVCLFYRAGGSIRNAHLPVAATGA